MSIRERRAAAIRTRISHGLAYDLGHWLPLLLDDLEQIDRERLLDPANILPPANLAWAQAHPDDLEPMLGMGLLAPAELAAAKKRLAALPFGPRQAELVARIEEEAAEVTAQAKASVEINPGPEVVRAETLPARPKPAPRRATTRRAAKS